MKQPINILVNDNTPAFLTWLAGCRKLVTDYYDKHYPYINPETLEVSFGQRYIKIINCSYWFNPITQKNELTQRSAWCFVDRSTGDVLKAARWNAPAKHARGNIFLPDNGLGCMSNYGAAYLR